MRHCARIVQRRLPARQTAGARPLQPPMPKRKGAPMAVLGVDGGFRCDQFSDDSAIAAVRRHVQRGLAIAAHGGAGVRGWTPQGTPAPTGTRKHNSRWPRGSTTFRL
jgi:hypothetical protein